MLPNRNGMWEDCCYCFFIVGPNSGTFHVINSIETNSNLTNVVKVRENPFSSIILMGEFKDFLLNALDTRLQRL